MASPSETPNFRLPTSVKPRHYALTIKTDLEKCTFEGVVAVDLDVQHATSAITFNAAESLDVEKCELEVPHSGQRIEATSQTRDPKLENVTAEFTVTLEELSEVILHVKFKGELADNMLGYYRSSAEHEGKKRYYSLTQFEATHARRAFPCWDEPSLKAEFTITMISRSDTVNISNMAAASEFNLDSTNEQATPLLSFFADTKEADGWKATVYEKTPKMSTYLVAVANGHFSHLESSYTSPISNKTRPLRIYATADNLHQAQFALDIKSKVIPIYEKIFDVEYPLPKLDTLVASDFDGAMENWGLITGRTSVFLYDPKKSDLAAKKWTAKVQSHECAHMWFGNIVTMEWWDNLWLKEGFATFVGEVMIIDRLFPEWKVFSYFLIEELEPALALDSLRSSHPIEVKVPDPNQINQIFDALSYSKAASMLNMLASYVGEQTFLEGVGIYLKKHLYGNSVTRNLWEGVAEATAKEATGLDIAKMMENWTLKIGYPVLRVQELDGGIHICQDRFLQAGDVKDEENETIWHVPLSILTLDENGQAVVDRRALLDQRETTIKLDNTKLYKLNANTTGVYRVAYTAEHLEKLGDEAAKTNTVLSTQDRMGLVSDAMALAKAGYSKTSSALGLIAKLRQEKEWLVWSSINAHLKTLADTLWEQPEKVRDQLDAFRRSLFVPLVDQLGYDYDPSDSPDVSELRTLAIKQAALAKEEKVIKELRDRFAIFQEKGVDTQIPADLESITFSTAVKYGGRAEYETVKKVFANPATPSAKIAAMEAMTSPQDESLLDETFAFLLKEVQLQDWSRFFMGFAANIASRRRVAKFCMDNWPEIAKRFEGNYSIGRIVTQSFGKLTSEQDAAEVLAFFKDKDRSTFNQKLDQVIEAIRCNDAWLRRSEADLQEWLSMWSKSSNA